MSTVIKVENVSKQYRLGQIGTGTVAHDINRWLHKIRGNEDPYLKIGDENDRTRKTDSEYVWALRDINFEIKQGEVTGIIGRNGAGKSTLLKILSRTTAPTTGAVKIKGRVASLLEVGTGFHPDLSGRENVFLNGAILGMTKREIKNKFDAIVDFAGIEKYIDTPVKRYSSGMYVRLAFAVAAYLDPDILIVDEVLAVGDAEFQKKALGKMKEASNQQGRTVLFVSHNMGAVKSLCSRALLIENGRVTKDGDAADVVTAYLKTENKAGKISDRTDRYGSGIFRFTNISFTDKDGSYIEGVLTGEQLTARMEYELKENIDLANMIIGVSFQDEYQNPVLYFVSDEVAVERVPANEQGNRISLSIPSLNLRGGSYSVRLFASYKTTSEGDICDVIEDAAYFNVISADYWNRGKVIRDGLNAVTPSTFYI